MPGMSGRYNGSATWTFIAGFSAAKLGDTASADKAVEELHKMTARTESGGNAYAAKPSAIMEREVGAVSRLARGQKDDAVRLAKEAVDIELTMSAARGTASTAQRTAALPSSGATRQARSGATSLILSAARIT